MGRTGWEITVDLILRLYKIVMSVIRKNKRIALGISMSILLAIIIVIVNGVNNMRPENALKNFAHQIENGNINDITLTIYFMSPHILTFIPLDAEALMNSSSTSKFVVDGYRLAEHINLFKQINYVDLIPYEDDEYYFDARIYYVFSNKRNCKIFDVLMCGLPGERSVYINGREFIMDNIFVDMIMPFLPYASEQLE